ncbi:hypothetical protein [Streptomyces sp. NPDC086787]|uniref:hypothetical protein n=1 Tax=Streptomyces sp. NPDC086787 TaxID=3365759 RepID=UPI00382317B9
MNLSLTRLLGAGAAVAIGATALLGTGAGTAVAGGRAHCDRGERDMWSRAGTDVIGHSCTMPDNRRRWYTIEIDSLVQTHYRTSHLEDGVARKETVHDETVRCLGYIQRNSAVRWFGCPP